MFLTKDFCVRQDFVIRKLVRKQVRIIVWHESFAGDYFFGLAIFCVLWELIFAIRTDWFFLMGIDFCDFQKSPRTQH